MKNLVKALALFLGLCIAGGANAQSTGQLQAGQIWGNPSASKALAKGTTIGAVLDQEYACNARGDVIFRGLSLWTCLAPGTSGLPLISQGAGADLVWGQVPNSGLVNPATTVNGITCTLGSTCTITASAGTVSVGVTTVASGTDKFILYDNAGVLGNYGVTGTGTTAVLAAAPTLTGIPVLGAPTATSLALGGATIGANSLAVTGTSIFNSNINLNGISLTGTYTVGGTPSIAGSAINSGTVSGSFLSNINLAASGNGGVTGVLPLANGGTGSATAAPARNSTGLNIDETTSTGDANYVILPGDRTVYHTALSVARTDTLPAANAVNAGQVFYLTDFAGVASVTKTITLQRAGADTINGVTSVVAVNAAFGAAIFWSDGVSKWTFFPASAGGGTGTVTNIAFVGGNGVSVSGANCTSGITSTGTCTFTGAVPEPQGRITLAANTPVMGATSCSGSPCANQTTLRYDCYTGAGVPYFNGSNDLLDTVSSCEVTDAMVSAASAGQVVASNVYDVWWVHGGANRICLAMSAAVGGGGGWSADTGGSNAARGTGYTQLDRITRPYTTNKNSITNCFNAATNYGPVSANQGTYLGTIFANANGQVSYVLGSSAAGGGAASLYVWNMYNRVLVNSTVTDSNSTWTNSFFGYRMMDGSANNRTNFVLGLPDEAVAVSLTELLLPCTVSTTCNGFFGFVIDGTTSADKTAGFTDTEVAGISNHGGGTATFNYSGQSGAHFVQAVENNSGGVSSDTRFGANWMSFNYTTRM